MNKSLLALLVSTPLFFVGCGSDNDDKHHGGGGGGDVDATTDEIVQEITGVVARETLLQGFVDPLILVTDNAYEGVPCKSGTVNKEKEKMTFNQCTLGNFGKLTGTVEANVSGNALTYTYDDFIVDSDNGEQYRVKGSLKTEEFEKEGKTILSTDFLNVKHKELIEKDHFINVNYDLSKYKLEWKDLTPGKTVSLNSEGSVAVTDSSVGDYAVNFSTPIPLVVTINEEDEVNPVPSDGQIYIVDQSNDKSEISVWPTTTATDAKFKATIDGKLLFDKTEKWSTILGF